MVRERLEGAAAALRRPDRPLGRPARPDGRTYPVHRAGPRGRAPARRRGLLLVRRLAGLLVQDRLFDTSGQLRFPDGSDTAADLNGPPPNPPTHPFWIPEFFGDAMCVNGRTWPVFKVEPRRYRFRFVDGCNARFLSMNLTDAANAGSSTPPSAVSFWQIGTDGGL